MGLHHRTHRVFTSAHLAYPPARLSTLRSLGGWPSPNESGHSYRQLAPVVSAVLAIDPRGMAERLGCSRFRGSSAARRIGRLDGGTQGCLKWIVFHANAARVCHVHGETTGVALPAGAPLLRSRTSLKADDRHASVRLVTSRLLAAS